MKKLLITLAIILAVVAAVIVAVHYLPVTYVVSCTSAAILGAVAGVYCYKWYIGWVAE